MILRKLPGLGGLEERPFNIYSVTSRACEAGPIRSLFQVLLPMCRKGIAASAALTFVLLFHEFSASLMARSARTQVIGSVMYDVWAGGVYSQVAVLALIMVVVPRDGLCGPIPGHPQCDRAAAHQWLGQRRGTAAR